MSKLSTPAAQGTVFTVQCDFKRPSRMGETIALELRLLRLGRRSLTLDIACSGAVTDDLPGALRWRAQAVIVTTSLAHDASIPIPDDVLQGIARWQQPAGDPA